MPTPPPLPELVELLTPDLHPCGTAPKATVHTADTPLHRAFSCFLFRPDGQLLLQQRAAHKVTWPSIWSNSCCGHPGPGEPTPDAVVRRLRFELRVSAQHLTCILPHYQYHATHLGITEHEHCPVFVGLLTDSPTPNPEEVQALDLVPWGDFSRAIINPTDTTYDHFSIWCQEEVTLLTQSSEFQAWWQRHITLPR